TSRGLVRTVNCFADGLSMSDRSSLGDLQRLENEQSYVDQLAALRYQYIRDERDLQRRRTIVQNLLYGNTSTYASGFYPGAVPAGGYWGWGGGWGYGLPLGYAYPGVVSTAEAYPSGNAGTTTQSLLFGVGDEGVIKTEMARVLAGQATPQYAAEVRNELASAQNRAMRSETLAKTLNLPRA